MSRGAVNSRQDCRELVDQQLERLHTDRIDMYLLHNVRPDSWEDFQRFGALDAIERARDQGKVVHVGFSSHADTPFFRELLDMHDWDFCQIQFNYLDNDIQAGEEGLKEAHSRGLGVIIMEPLKGGFLARDDLFYRHKLHEQRPDWSAAEWGLRWIWDRPEVHLVLSGMNALDQVTENCRVARDARQGGFDPADRRLLSKVKEEVAQRLKAPCSACGYCMPCPQGVNIPRMLTLYNEVYLQGDATWSKVMYNVCTEESVLSKHCTACGRCEGLCPQRLPIPRLMAENHGMLFQPADQ
jgi:predicted aldo/keto reductase-like oxidoreductase